MGLLEVNTGLIVWTTVTFLLVVFVLKRFAWKPILEGLNQREERIREAVEGAERARAEVDQLLEEHKTVVAEAEKKAKEIVDEGRRDAEVLKNQMLDEARQEANQALERAKREIELAKDKALATIKDQTIEMALTAASKVVRKSLDGPEHRRLVEESVSEMSRG